MSFAIRNSFYSALLLALAISNVSADPIDGLYVNSNGKVGIGTDSPTKELTVSGDIRVETTSNTHAVRLGVNNLEFLRTTGSSYISQGSDNHYNKLVIQTGGSNSAYFQSNGNLDVRGNVNANSFVFNSDIRFKENIEPLKGNLQKLLALEGVSYRMNNAELHAAFQSKDADATRESESSTYSGDDRVHFGLVAQDVEQVFPDIVVTDPETGKKGIAYVELISPMIEAIKEQQEQIEELQA